ncbi:MULTISPECIES: GntR family transcriptional regulator [Achromobacter]|jgi:DNA-binding GntR family transcriptional regulator|uniref:GntR family transcriptional regulator n=1 Tax=Alcaligenes xylosoxydans xylosoxydans TaxID=85698 RepID=A0A424W5Q3_ALCXX|nr:MULTISPECIES: GntR family transcriptional regulator [Achromobacter]MBC9903271.1 GntR family transcriptional regulator [Achromobacter xylosoxidans]MBD0871804.1 GntR family transcriptional regulator [Achromobacter xylosoxidans]MDH1300195.1 GntR family transcriptional regulator [Achromobacter sp. GD03932]QNP88189.1 GntR family transcriptional regulator [Achromobacter xylosoxidans]RPJ88531.1 GntR family transcriptional regulator [Achromobacter xylosoxidans]
MSSARDYVYAELRRRLMAGSFMPGERLREEHIAAELSVSRTPVRSAIERLVTDGLVKHEGRRGAVVLGWQDRDIDEAFELRMLLEPYSAKAAAERASPEQILELERINQCMLDAINADAPDSVAQVQHYNNQFHHALLDAAQSARVRSMVENLLDMPIIIGSFYFYTKDDMLRSVEHHRQIIAALRARDAECAQIAMRFHLAATHLLFRSHRKPGQ